MRLLVPFSLLCICCEIAYARRNKTAPHNAEVELSVTNQTMDVGDNGTGGLSESFSTGCLTAFTVTVVSEIGDKTFFIAVVLALTYSAACVFAGAISALVFMTLLSAGLGLVSSVIPHFWVQCLSALLFLVFGVKMLREGCTMSNNAGKEEFEDVQKTVDSKISTVKSKNLDVETGSSRFPLRWVFLEAFAMTFLAEWGDRSQIATVILAAKHNTAGVVIGAVLGHTACTFLAVAGGKIVADKVSLKAVTIFGGVLFLAFAAWSTVNAIQESMEPTTS